MISAFATIESLSSIVKFRTSSRVMGARPEHDISCSVMGIFSAETRKDIATDLRALARLLGLQELPQ
jgi:hypothetical protein